MSNGGSSSRASILSATVMALGAILAAYIGGRAVMRVVFDEPLAILALPWSLAAPEVQSDTDEELAELLGSLDLLDRRVESLERKQNTETSRLSSIATQAAVFEQRVSALSTPSHAPGVEAAVDRRLASLEETLARLTRSFPTTVERVTAIDGLPARGTPIRIASVLASSTDPALDEAERPIFDPELIIDGNTSTIWRSKVGDLQVGWVDIVLESEATVTGLRAQSLETWPLIFQDAVASFSDGSARELHLTPAQLTSTGWHYFPFVPDVTTRSIRLNIRAVNPSWRRYHSADQWQLSEVEIYGP